MILALTGEGAVWRIQVSCVEDSGERYLFIRLISAFIPWEKPYTWTSSNGTVLGKRPRSPPLHNCEQIFQHVKKTLIARRSTSIHLLNIHVYTSLYIANLDLVSLPRHWVSGCSGRFANDILFRSEQVIQAGYRSSLYQKQRNSVSRFVQSVRVFPPLLKYVDIPLVDVSRKQIHPSLYKQLFQSES